MEGRYRLLEWLGWADLEMDNGSRSLMPNG